MDRHPGKRMLQDHIVVAQTRRGPLATPVRVKTSALQTGRGVRASVKDKTTNNGEDAQ